MGVGRHAHRAHLIDFGLAKEFRDPDTNQHIPYTETPGLTGTAVFASIHSHLGMELGRRNDLESLAYGLIYFLRGSLPWQGMQSRRCDLVVEIKQRTSTRDLCLGLPTELCTFLEYTCSLSFDNKPDYGYLCGLFDNTSSSDGVENGLAFDWESSI
jgi:serine/threonine protein kinase